jgi:hypothetical protein
MNEGKIMFAYEEELEIDGDMKNKEMVGGDVGTTVVVQWSCITPRVADGRCLRSSIYQITCTIKNKVYKFLIDAGSCKNIVSTEEVSKLGLVKEQYPKSCRLT